MLGKHAGTPFLIALLLVWLAVIPSPASAQSGDAEMEGHLIRSIELLSDGPVRRISREDLGRLIQLEVGQPYSVSAARHTILQLYSTDLFHDIHVKPDIDQSGEVTVSIQLFRKFLVERISFKGDVRLGERELRRELNVREGEPLSEEAVETSKTRLLSLYRRSGFNRASITPNVEVFSDRARAAVTYQVEAGPQATIRSLDFDIEGESSEAELADLVRLKLQGAYSDQESEEDLQRLETHLALQGFLQAEVYLRNGIRYEADSNTVALTFRVVPHEQTRIVMTGDDVEEATLSDLPIFRQRTISDVTIRDSQEALASQLQADGYLTAEVNIRSSREAEAPPTIEIGVQKGKRLKVKAVWIEGSGDVAAGNLLSLLETRPAGIFGRGILTRETLEGDVERLKTAFQQLGYLESLVEYRLDITDGEVEAVFTVTSGPEVRVRKLEVTGTSQLRAEEVLAQISLKEGEPFSPFSAGSDRANVISLYESHGFRRIDFRSEVIRVEPTGVDVLYHIEEGPRFFLEDLAVTGNIATKRSVINREILLERGAPLSYEKTLQSETNLYNLAVFNRVRVEELDSFEDPTRRLLLFQLEEARKYTVVYGIGYSHSFGSRSTEGVRGTLGITNNNFMGAARTLALNLRAGAQRQRGNLSYTLPRLLGRRIPTVVSLTADNENRVTDNEYSYQVRGRPYDSLRLIASAQSERILSRRESLFFRYNFEKIRLDVPPELEKPLEFFREEERLILSSVSTSYLSESRDDPLDPSSGSFVSGDLSWSTSLLGSDRNFFRFQLQGQYYLPLTSIGPSVTLATALRVGIIGPYGAATEGVTNKVPISERFFAGGPTSLRGVPLDLAGPILRDENGDPILVSKGNEQVPVPVGGNLMLIGNVELRFPLISFLRGTLFYDVGSVYERIGDFGKEGTTHDFGFGISLKTPIGPVRLDAAYNPDPPEFPGFNRWNFHINLGHPF